MKNKKIEEGNLENPFSNRSNTLLFIGGAVYGFLTSLIEIRNPIFFPGLFSLGFIKHFFNLNSSNLSSWIILNYSILNGLIWAFLIYYLGKKQEIGMRVTRIFFISIVLLVLIVMYQLNGNP